MLTLLVFFVHFIPNFFYSFSQQAILEICIFRFGLQELTFLRDLPQLLNSLTETHLASLLFLTLWKWFIVIQRKIHLWKVDRLRLLTQGLVSASYKFFKIVLYGVSSNWNLSNALYTFEIFIPLLNLFQILKPPQFLSSVFHRISSAILPLSLWMKMSSSLGPP